MPCRNLSCRRLCFEDGRGGLPRAGGISVVCAVSDGVRLYCEDTGSGTPIVFVHEFAGDCRSWEPQVRYFSRRYRCITYNARGYPPSDVPEASAAYGQAQAADDIAAVMDHFDIARAHVVGLSMGGFATVHFGMRHGERARSLVVAGCGYGAPPDKHAAFSASAQANADRIDQIGIEAFAAAYSEMEGRQTLKRKDPRGFAAYLEQFGSHSVHGSAMHMRHVQGARPSLWDFADELAGLAMPVLVVSGDTDGDCLETGIFLKRTIGDCAFWLAPDTGHAVNLEEPDAFNRELAAFFTAAEARSPA